MSSSDPSYTVFVRLPFPRGDFVDPPSVEWDAAKDKALWKILSKASKNSDIDWSELATKFEVSLAFLLQQAAWLYERQLLQVRAQMRKVGASKGSSAPSPVPGSTSEAGGESMRRTGSGGGGLRIASALSARRDSPIPKAESSVPNTPGRPTAPPFSRTSSANTTITSRNIPQTSPRPTHATISRPSQAGTTTKSKSRPASTAIDHTPQNLRSPQPSALSSPSSSTTSSSSSDSSSSASHTRPITTKSHLLRTRPRFTAQKSALSEDADDDEEEEPAFLPSTTTTTTTSSTDTAHAHHDPSATLRGDPRHIGAGRRGKGKVTEAQGQTGQTSDDSSASSSAPTPINRRPNVDVMGKEGIAGRRGPPTPMSGPGPLSPKRTVELAGRSPGVKGKGREGSDGTPSMGSSFSDLDDASVTQSALEEALASNMQAGGGMASRMSSISQALRSKYL